MEMGELADEVERAQLATCTKMESLGQSIVTKMERLNCPHVQQGKQLLKQFAAAVISGCTLKLKRAVLQLKKM